MTTSSSHKRQYSAGLRDYDIFGNRSLSSNRFEPTLDRPQTSNNRDSIRRDVSADAFLTKSQNLNSENAPFANGKRNPRFFHPSFTSNEVFYDHNYGYKNDLPNDRLLTPVRNDRFSNQHNDGSRTPNRGDRTPNRGDITPGRGDRTPQRGDRTPERGDRTPTRNNIAPTTPTRYQRLEATEDRFSRTQNFEPQQRLYNEELTPRRDSFRDTVEERQPRERKLSSISQNDQAPLTPVRNRDLSQSRRLPEESQLKKPDETARFFGRSEKAPEIADNIRDDRSEASTVISALSSAGYVCPKCYNRHVSDCKQAKSDVERHQAKNSEKNLAVMNRQSLQDEEEKKKQSRARRVEETRELGDKLQQAYYDKQNQRRWPTKEQTTTFDPIFNRQDEAQNIQKALGESFRVHLKDQMKYQEAEKEREKKSNSVAYNTSLPVGEGYRNKYLDSPENVRATLKDQVEEKLYNQRRQQDEDKRIAQSKIAEAQQSLAEDNQFKKSKESNQRRELKEAYERGLEEKEAKKKNNMTQKTLEKHFADQGHNQYKVKQQEAEAKFKLQLNAFKQGLAKQIENASYRKIYEDKKQLQGNQTSFGPQKHSKKVYPCGECPGLFEKKYLTKLQ